MMVDIACLQITCCLLPRRRRRGVWGPVILFRTDGVNPPVPKVLPGAKRLTAFRPGRYCASDGKPGSFNGTG